MVTSIPAGTAGLAARVSASVDVCTSVPEVAVTVTVERPAAPVDAACNEIACEAPEAPEARLNEAGAAVTAVGKPLTLSATVPVKLPVGEMVTVAVAAAAPGVMVMAEGEMASVKSAGVTGAAGGVGATGEVGAVVDALVPELQPAR